MIALHDTKRVKDTGGHQAGDDYRRAAAMRLAGIARPGDTVARIGGDEFGVLRTSSQSVNQDGFAADIRAALSAPRKPAALQVRAAVGVAQCVPGDDLSDAIRRADIAMYLDKSLVRPRTPDPPESEAGRRTASAP